MACGVIASSKEYVRNARMSVEHQGERAISAARRRTGSVADVAPPGGGARRPAARPASGAGG